MSFSKIFLNENLAMKTNVTEKFIGNHSLYLKSNLTAKKYKEAAKFRKVNEFQRRSFISFWKKWEIIYFPEIHDLAPQN